MVARVGQEVGVCPIPGNIYGQVWQGSEHCDPVEDVPALIAGSVGLDDL